MDFSDVTILVVGDVMLDRFLEGEIERISPEAPVPVLRLARRRAMPGGAGNVACNVASLGGRAILVGLVGDDEASRTLSDLLAGAASIEPRLVVSSTRPTICKTRYIAGRQQVVRTDEESLEDLTAAEAAALLGAVDRHVSRAGAVVLSDYGKRTLSDTVIASVMRCAGEAGVPVFVDPKSRDFGRYRGAACVTPNARELAAAAASEVPDEGAVTDACRALIAACDLSAILATRSEKGMVLVERDGAATGVAARAREVFDVSGAGDTVIAALALGFASGLSLVQAMHVANAAAGVVVSKLGTATASLAEVLRELDAQDAAEIGVAGRGSALAGLEETAALVAHWRAQGLTVGFTNGCFDILHAGHVQLLAAARRSCDRLIVAINDDASVSRLKGPSRPVNPLAGRAAVLAALRHVDGVVAFADDTPLALIARLRPDVLVKGSDYTIETVVGADLVQSYGGRVVLADLLAAHSTTSIIERARRDEGSGLCPEPHQDPGGPGPAI